jgi:hypothetical protein
LGYIHLIRNLAAIISLAVVFGGSFALSVEAKASEAKTSRHSSRSARNYFVPPPPPYTPSVVPSTLDMTNAQAVRADAGDAVLKKTQVVQPNPSVRYSPSVETKILKHIDYFDSEISGSEKEIGKLLNL